MVQVVLVGLVAGIGAALLFVAPFGGTPLAIPLFVLTGLPIAIAGLGWGGLSALIAVLAGIAGTFVLAEWNGAAIFALMFALPVAWATAVATERRMAMNGQWAPLGLVLLNAAGAIALGTIGVGIVIGYDPPTLIPDITAAMVEWVTSANPGSAPPTTAEIEPLVTINVLLMPATVALIGLAMVVLDLYLAAKAVRLSDRPGRPGEDLSAVAMPVGVSVALAGATLLAFFPGVMGDIAEAIAGALGGAVAFVGLAVIHALTRGVGGRIAILAIVYGLVLLSGVPIIFLALLGITESVFHLRARRLGPRGRTPTHETTETTPMEIILLERIARLGQMGDVVRVKDGYARNFLLPQGKAMRANEANKKQFESNRGHLEARNLERRQEAEAAAAKVNGQAFIVVRQAGETGQLYGSVSARDITEAMEAAGTSINRNQVALNQPIKTIGLHSVKIALHPEVEATVTVNVARSDDEAARQARGEDLTRGEADEAVFGGETAAEAAQDQEASETAEPEAPEVEAAEPAPEAAGERTKKKKGKREAGNEE